MTSSATGPAATRADMTFRSARAAVFAVVCLGLSVTAHVVAGGPVSATSAVLALVLAFVVALAASGRERTVAVILPLLAGVQAALHVLFSLAHAPSHTDPMGHLHSGLLPDLGMLVAHGWAVGLTALWMARGEAALWATLRGFAVRLRRVLIVLVTPARVPLLTASTAGPGILRSAVLRHFVSRRGPPATVVAVPG
ncbi:MFS transporter [Streptosporangium sp. NPDC023615]|uniref:MFS transporter n=1 Tax=Streptosporangium sp. NPDC023615 TaxID=3154794 RepID=UPI00341E5D25